VLKYDDVGENVATFCLLDQRTFECEWATVKALAGHKTERKIELFYFVPTGWLVRALSAVKRPETIDGVTRWWGKDDWQQLRDMSAFDQAALFCRRFREELSYRYAYSFPIFAGAGSMQVMYYMVHATDHPLAPGQMARAYSKVTGVIDPPEQLQLELGNLDPQGAFPPP
jgi:three-Cys-motif partner protein